MRKKNSYIAGLTAFLLVFMMAGQAVAQDIREISLEKYGMQVGIASFYSDNFNGQVTSAGEIFSNSGLTAASNTLPLGTYVKVTNLKNHKWVVVKINDRMHKRNKRAIDITRYAARKLGMVSRGIARVKVEAIPPEFYDFYHISPDDLVVYGERENITAAGS